MARINIEECWWTDPRRERLAKLTGSLDLADAAAIRAWRLAQEHWRKDRGHIPLEIFNQLEFAQALLGSGLAVLGDTWVYVRGSSQHHEWTVDQREKSKSGGVKSAKRPRDAKGRLLPKEENSPSPVQAESKGVQPSLSLSSSSSLSFSGSDSLNSFGQTSVRPIKRLDFDFNEAYKDYPRKIKKAEGFKRLEKQMKSVQDFEDFKAAVKRYKQHCISKQIEEQYILHFSTFVGDAKTQPWRDWLDPETGTSSIQIQNEISLSQYMENKRLKENAV